MPKWVRLTLQLPPVSKWYTGLCVSITALSEKILKWCGISTYTEILAFSTLTWGALSDATGSMSYLFWECGIFLSYFMWLLSWSIVNDAVQPQCIFLAQCKFLLHWAVHMRYKSYTQVSRSTHTHKIPPLRTRPIEPIASESVHTAQWLRDHIKSTTSPKKGNFCQRWEGVFAGHVILFVLLEGEGGSGNKRQEFPFFRDVELLTWSLISFNLCTV